jgi:peptide deformylase
VKLVKKPSPKLLELTHFGNPILRKKTRRLSVDEIRSDKTQQLIADIRYTNQTKQYGVGLAAPQVGKSVALSVIGIKPTPNRPNLTLFESVIINPAYEGVGRPVGMWEGCQSAGSGEGGLFAQAERYKTIRASWYDEHGELHEEELSGFVAHVFQHETDHLNGVLFVDKVKDTTTYMTADEYRRRIVGTNK